MVGWLELLICSGVLVLPWLDRIFYELAPVDNLPSPQIGLMQLRVTDLLLTGVCYGVWLSVAALFSPRTESGFIWIAAYIFISECLGLFAAMDVCRRSRHRGDVLQRSSIFLIFFIVFPLVLPAALLAWGRWAQQWARS